MASSTIFTGSSTYSQDFLGVIERSMAIAELPLLQLQQQRIRANEQQTAVNDLYGRFESLRIALETAASRAASTQLSASFSSSGVATATLGEAAQKGSYSLEVLSLGSFTSFLSSGGVEDPVSEGLGTELTKTLIIDGVETELSLAGNSLRDLADAINASGSGLGVSIINVASGGAPSYKLVLQGNKLGAQTIELRDGNATGPNLLEDTALQEGAAVSYKVSGVLVSGESRNVTIAPGVDLELTGLSTGPVHLQIGRSANGVADAMQSMVAAFNLASGKVNEHRGAGGGALQGSSTMQTLGQVLRRLTGFTSAEGDFRNAVDLGLSVDDQGTLLFDATKLSGLSEESLGDLLSFLGTQPGEGFLGAALKTIREATDSEFGILSTEKNALSAQMTSSAKQVETMQERLDRMEQDLRDRFAIVDSTIAALQQQAHYINTMFEAMRMASQAYNR